MMNIKLNEEFVDKTWKLYSAMEENLHNSVDKKKITTNKLVNHKELWRWIKSLLKIRNKIENEYQERYLHNPVIIYFYNLMEKYNFKDVNVFIRWLDEKMAF